MKPWQRIAASDSDGDSRGAFDDLRRSLANDLEREPGSALLVPSSLEALLAAFITRAQQRRGEIGLVAFELESWKTLHERVGAPVLESAVADLGTELRRRVRTSDEVGRLGEAQIAVVLPGCEAPSLASVSERLLASLESVELALGSQRVRPSLLMVSLSAPLGPTTTSALVLESLRSALDRVRGAGPA